MDRAKQLIHIKQLYLRAENLSRKADDVSLIILIQLLDFVVESLLKLTIHSFPSPSHFAPPQKGYYAKIKQLENERYKPYMDYYRVCDEVIGILRDPTNGLSITDLPLRRDMERLHEIRNDVQHKGAIPNPNDLKKYMPLVESFLTNTYQDIYSVNFGKLSSLSLIHNAEIRAKLETSFNKLESQEWTESVCEAAIAFHLLIVLMQEAAHPNGLSGLKGLFKGARAKDGKKLNFMSRSQQDGLKNLLQEIARLQEQVAVIGFGIDYSDYINIKPQLPKVALYPKKDGEGRELTAFTPQEFSTENGRYIEKQYNEVEATYIVQFVEKQVLEFQA